MDGHSHSDGHAAQNRNMMSRFVQVRRRGGRDRQRKSSGGRDVTGRRRRRISDAEGAERPPLISLADRRCPHLRNESEPSAPLRAHISSLPLCCDDQRLLKGGGATVNTDGAAFQRLVADSLRLLAAQLGDERHTREWSRNEFQ